MTKDPRLIIQKISSTINTVETLKDGSDIDKIIIKSQKILGELNKQIISKFNLQKDILE